MKTTSAIAGIVWERVREDVKRAAMRFMWMPGERPVKVPARRPRRSAMEISKSIFIIRK